jgi:hypothetical protein
MMPTEGSRPVHPVDGGGYVVVNIGVKETHTHGSQVTTVR